jgi:hypothetical protein
MENGPSVLYFDCFAGISGDMTVGALLDLGIDRERFLAELAKVEAKADPFRVEIREMRVGLFRATDFNVILQEPEAEPSSRTSPSMAPAAPPGGRRHRRGPTHRHRNLFDVERILSESGLSEPVAERSKAIFRLIAAAEAAVHGRPLEEVFFHEVGAIDSIADIVGACICIELLGPRRIVASPPNLGAGLVECAHGTLPVPAPATAEILKGVPVYSSGVRGELVTPTGAAILKSLASEFAPLPPMRVERIGYGRGKKEYGIPNLLRVFWGREGEAPEAGR